MDKIKNRPKHIFMKKVQSV